MLIGSMASSAIAGTIVFDSGSARSTGIRLKEDALALSSTDTLIVECRLDHLEANPVQSARGDFVDLTAPGQQHRGLDGAPSLPVMSKLVEIPAGATLRIRHVESQPEVHSLAALGLDAPLVPHQPPRPKSGTIPFIYDARAYTMAGYHQEEIVSVEDVGWLRDRRLARVRFAPVAYDAVQKKIEVRRHIVAELTIEDASVGRTRATKRAYSSPIFDNLGERILVPKSLRTKAKASARPLAYLIVADRMFESTLAPFIQWKTEKGFRVKTVYTDEVGGANAQALKQKVHDLYKNPTAEFPAPDFLLLVGDHEQVPAFDGETGSHVTDLPYVAVTEGDYLPDILTGRFSATSPEQLAPQIAKTLEYEKMQLEDRSFLQEAVLIAGWDSSFAEEWGFPQMNYAKKYYFNDAQGYNRVDVFYSRGPDENASAILERANAGVGILNYGAHGYDQGWADPGFTNEDIGRLANRGKYPLVIGNCCLTSKFEVGECFAEAWLRADGKGAIGYIGGTNSTYWDEDLWWANGFYEIPHPNPDGKPPEREGKGQGAYDSLFAGTHRVNAAILLAGNLAVEAAETEKKKYYWEIYHLMGDPSLMTSLGAPRDAEVGLPETLTPGQTVIEVTAPARSYVGVTSGGTLHGAGTVCDDGKLSLALEALPATGTARVVVTGANLVPAVVDLPIGTGSIAD